MRVIDQTGRYFGYVNCLGIAKAKPELRYGKVAKELREEKGLSLQDLSKELSIKVALIEGIESQTKGMTEDVMKRYCDFFGKKKEDFFDIDLDRLICGDNGIVLKTYKTSEECKKAFDKFMEVYKSNNLDDPDKEICIDFREEEK